MIQSNALQTATRAPANPTTTIAVLSWAWAAAAAHPGHEAAPRLLAAHPADAHLAAHLAGHLGATTRFPATCAS